VIYRAFQAVIFAGFWSGRRWTRVVL